MLMAKAMMYLGFFMVGWNVYVHLRTDRNLWLLLAVIQYFLAYTLSVLIKASGA
jgi:hypothetical protein